MRKKESTALPAVEFFAQFHLYLRDREEEVIRVAVL